MDTVGLIENIVGNGQMFRAFWVCTINLRSNEKTLTIYRSPHILLLLQPWYSTST